MHVIWILSAWTRAHAEIRRRRCVTPDSGQATVEFALAASIFLTVMFGIVEFSYAAYTFSMVQHGANEAARRGMVLNKIRTDTNAVGNSYVNDPAFAGNYSATYTNPACDTKTIAGTVGCNRLLLPSTFTVIVCAPTATANTDPANCPSSPTDPDTTVPAGRFIEVTARYAYKPLISFPFPSSFTMTGFARTQTQ